MARRPGQPPGAGSDRHGWGQAGVPNGPRAASPVPP